MIVFQNVDDEGHFFIQDCRYDCILTNVSILMAKRSLNRLIETLRVLLSLAPLAGLLLEERG
jgi:hypothetical protein